MTAHTVYGGSDTGCGFEHFYSDWLPGGAGARVCLLKGAPGTGAEALLQTLAEGWQRQGRTVWRFPCALEPDSLEAAVSGQDAVINCAALRGLHGENVRIIDLDACLDPAVMRPQLAEAGELSRRIAQLRRRARRCLRGAAAAQSDSAAVYAAAADMGAVCNLRMELLQWMGGTAGAQRRMFAQMITPAGVLGPQEPFARANTLCLDLPWGMDADDLLYPVAVALNARGAGYWAGMQLLDGQKLCHLCSETHAILTYAEPGCETRALRLDEGVLRREQEALAFNRAAYDLWMGQAIEALHRAGECRGQLAALTARAVRAEARERLRREAFSFFMDF